MPPQNPPPVNWFMAEGARNCPEGTIINNADDCKMAGDAVGRPYVAEIYRTSGRPAGCFWTRKRAYLNTNFNADPGVWAGVGGLCKGVWGMTYQTRAKNQLV